MHDILNINLQYLEKSSQTLANRLKDISHDSSLELITAVSGDWTAIKNYPGGYRFLHSRVDPKREARIWAENQCVIMPSFVILGIGLAYHVFELLEKCEKIADAYLIEADERMFQYAMQVHDFSSLIQNTSIHFLIGSPLSAIETLLSASFTRPFSLHIFPSIILSYPEIYSPVRESVEKHLCALRLSKGDDESLVEDHCLSFAKGVENLLNQMCAT